MGYWKNGRQIHNLTDVSNEKKSYVKSVFILDSGIIFMNTRILLYYDISIR